MLRLILFLLLVSQSALASTFTFYCPSIEDIKNNNYQPWLPLYSDIEELASDDDVNDFKNHITSFSAAEWDPRYLESGHCLYLRDDETKHAIVFSRDAWQPTETPNWNWLQKNLATCSSTNVNDCGFLE